MPYRVQLERAELDRGDRVFVLPATSAWLAVESAEPGRWTLELHFRPPIATPYPINTRRLAARMVSTEGREWRGDVFVVALPPHRVREIVFTGVSRLQEPP